MRTFALWQVVATAGYEAAWIDVDGVSMVADGRSSGQVPEPYWLSFSLATDPTGATTMLDVTATTGSATREVTLRRAADGWTVNGDRRPDLALALDVDLAFSPTTNSMPVLRHGLHRGGSDSVEFVMAFVEVPSLEVVASEQQYRHLRHDGERAYVRFSAGTFVRDLAIDRDGLVVDYPTMARRVPPIASV